MDDLGGPDLGIEPAHPRLAPAASNRAEAQLSDGLEEQERWAANDDRLVALDQSGVGEIRAEAVGVDDDRAAGRRHSRTAARKASPSSGVRSSITISLCGWQQTGAPEELLDGEFETLVDRKTVLVMCGRHLVGQCTAHPGWPGVPKLR